MQDDVPGEKDRDHPHQRSLWFSHGDVNGIDFWSEGKGIIQHREFVRLESGPPAVIVTRNDWLSPDGSKRILEDERTLKFGADADARWIDFDIVLKASDGPVVFGDTKEGSFGADGLVDPRRFEQGRAHRHQRGARRQARLGKPAAWVDYHGPAAADSADSQTVGLAILNHPSSFRFPTYWHVRTYGLFAANPFGLKDFTAGRETGEYTLPAGESLTLRYRVLLHKGDEKAGRVAEIFGQYAK